MSSLANTKLFNQNNKLTTGWYWAFKSSDLKKGKIKNLNFMGEEIVFFRGKEDGKVYALEAYCPHMGAHLAEGKVDKNGIRCFFHAWKFNGEGQLVDIPCRKNPVSDLGITKYHVREKYDVIWIFMGEDVQSHEVHFIPELKGIETQSSFGNTFVKECHPNVVMINAIDAQHFTSVHNLPLNIDFETKVLTESVIQFNNKTRAPDNKWFSSILKWLYREDLTYSMCYTNGSTGSVTIGPDFLHFHIIFALRPNLKGETEGLTILLTKKRKGILGLFNPIILFATKVVGNYFAKGDTEVFKSIRFQLKNPLKEDKSIINFIQHLEKQSYTFIEVNPDA